MTNLESTVQAQNEELAQVKRRYLSDDQLRARFEQGIAEAGHRAQIEMLETTKGVHLAEQQHREAVSDLRSAAQAAERKHAEEKMQLRLEFDSKLQSQAAMAAAQSSTGSKPANGGGGGGGGGGGASMAGTYRKKLRDQQVCQCAFLLSGCCTRFPHVHQSPTHRVPSTPRCAGGNVALIGA